MKILLLDRVHELFHQQFLKWNWVVEEGFNWTHFELIEQIHLFDGIIVRSKFVLDSTILSKATNLKFIARPGAGLENIDTNFCKLKKINVFRSPEGNRDAVAEHILGMLLALHTNLIAADNEVRNGKWNREKNRGYELKGKTVGIIGYGFMGSCFAEKLSGLGVEVIAYDKYKFNFSNSYAKEVSLNEIFEKTDVLSLHTPLTDETIKMVDFNFLKKFKKPLILINSARGQSVVLNDLLKAINSGIVAGACLDVLEFEKETFEEIAPNKVMDELKGKTNVIFSPHIAGWTHNSKLKMAEVLIQKIKNFFIDDNNFKQVLNDSK